MNSSWRQTICAPLVGGLADARLGALDVLFDVGRHCFLDDSDRERGVGGHERKVNALRVHRKWPADCVSLTHSRETRHAGRRQQRPDRHRDTRQSTEKRRIRRSTGLNKAFRAIKAQHSANRTRCGDARRSDDRPRELDGVPRDPRVLFVVWIFWNIPGVPLPKFDPYPYGMLTMIVSLEAIFLSIFVLMTQSRESKIGELREELTLQVNLRVEEEVTKTLHLVAGLYSRLGPQAGGRPGAEVDARAARSKADRGGPGGADPRVDPAIHAQEERQTAGGNERTEDQKRSCL